MNCHSRNCSAEDENKRMSILPIPILLFSSVHKKFKETLTYEIGTLNPTRTYSMELWTFLPASRSTSKDRLRFGLTYMFFKFEDK